MPLIEIDGLRMIPKAECKNRKLYRIHSRNLRLGVFREESGGFFGLRTKFGDTYVFEEYHYQNEAYATVAPLEELPEDLPADIALTETLGTVCEKCGQPAEYASWPEGGEREITLKSGGTMKVSGQWQHRDGTRCEDMAGRGKANDALFTWLRSMEAKYAP